MRARSIRKSVEGGVNTDPYSVAVGAIGNIYSSQHGENWNRFAGGNSNIYVDTLFDGDSFLVSGGLYNDLSRGYVFQQTYADGKLSGGKILLNDTDGRVEHIAYGNGRYLIGRGRNSTQLKWAYKNNPSTWFNVTSSVSGYSHFIKFLNGRFHFCTLVEIYSSGDCVQWTQDLPTVYGLGRFRDVVFVDGWYYIITESGNLLWMREKESYNSGNIYNFGPYDLISIEVMNDILYIAAPDGYMYKFNVKSKTPLTSTRVSTTDLNKVLFNGKFLLATDSSGRIYYSENGSTWYVGYDDSYKNIFYSLATTYNFHE